MELLNSKDISGVAAKGLSTARDILAARQLRKEIMDKHLKEMKQTPIQELTGLVHEVLDKAESPEVRRVFKLLLIVLDIQEEAELGVAIECFNAGERYGRDSHMAMTDGRPEQQPNFDRWFKQYSKQKK